MKAKKSSLIKKTSRKKILFKKGGVSNVDNILIQDDITINEGVNLLNIIRTKLGITNNTSVIIDFLNELNVIKYNKTDNNIFNDIVQTVINYKHDPNDDKLTEPNDPNRTSINFQLKWFEQKQSGGTNSGIDIFSKYELWKKEGKRNFITIDPTIIQIMIFEDNDENDIVYSLKLIIRNNRTLT